MAQLWSLRGLSWWELARRTCRKSWDDEIFGQSARLAFYFFFALFPTLLLLLIFVTKSGSTGPALRSTLVDCVKQVLPADAAALIVKLMQQLDERATVGTGALLAALYAAWGTLNGTWAMITGLNKAYEVEEQRPWWRVLSTMLGLTCFFSVQGLISLAAIVYGHHAGDMIGQQHGLPPYAGFLWRIMKWTIILTLLLFSFAVLYRFGPNLNDRRWQWSNPGAVIATALWLASTLLLGLYQEHFDSSRIYGGLAAVATLLFWLYLNGLALFFGGEANSEIEKAAAAAGHSDVRGAEEPRGGGEGTSGS